MKPTSLIFLSFIFVFQLACKNGGSNSNSNSEIEKLHEEVMVFHDEAMPKMPAIKRLGTKLYQVSELPVFKTWPDARKTELNQLLNQLGDAEKSMWNWMYAYHSPGEYPEGTDVVAYLNDEKVKAKLMRDKIFNSLDAATKFTEQYAIK